jgi:hypothetical protein
VTYRSDDAAHAERASSLIDEIARLEHEKLGHAATDQRLLAARRELAALQTLQTQPAAVRGGPGVIAHVLVFAATAGTAYIGYTLLI